VIKAVPNAIKDENDFPIYNNKFFQIRNNDDTGDNFDDINISLAKYTNSHETMQIAKIKVATACCARISYTVVGEKNKEPNYENDIKLHDRLAASGHWSPFEHIAKCMNNTEYYEGLNGQAIYNDKQNYHIPFDNTLGWSGNFRGFVQYRKTFTNENITKK
jgi:hypothetical protein